MKLGKTIAANHKNKLESLKEYPKKNQQELQNVLQHHPGLAILALTDALATACSCSTGRRDRLEEMTIARLDIY